MYPYCKHFSNMFLDGQLPHQGWVNKICMYVCIVFTIFIIVKGIMETISRKKK